MAGLVVIVCVTLATTARAFDGLEDAVLGKYPNATNLNTCGTCHRSFPGAGSGTNPYGAAFKTALEASGGDPAAAMTAIEGGDADGDGSTNGEEMMADAGFLPGFSCDTADTAVSPPSNMLDFVDPVDPGCDGVGPTTTLPPPTTTVPPPTTTTLPVVTTTTVIVTTTTIVGPTTTTLPGEPKCSQPVTCRKARCARPEPDARRSARQGLAVQRLGVLVCVLPRRTSGPESIGAATRSVDHRADNYKDAREDALNWINQLGNPYDMCVMDPEGRIGIDWGVYGVPETFVVDKKGIIRHKHTGPVTAEDVQQTLLPLIAKLQTE